MSHGGNTKGKKPAAGKGGGFTERLARTSALHPWRTIGIWVVLIVLAVVAIGQLLGTGITSDMKFRAAKPDSLTGQELLEQRLTGPRQITDFVIVRSATVTVDYACLRGLRRRPRRRGSPPSGPRSSRA